MSEIENLRAENKRLKEELKQIKEKIRKKGENQKNGMTEKASKGGIV